MDCTDPDHARLRAVILRAASTGAESLALHIERELGADALEKLLRLPHVALAPSVRHAGDHDIARMTMAEELAKLEAQRGWAAEISEATEDIVHIADESVTWRLGQAAEARNRALRSQQEDRAEYETSANGARIRRDEKAQFDALMEKIGQSKPGR
jgi:DNA primase